jgi:hypothetical protein
VQAVAVKTKSAVVLAFGLLLIGCSSRSSVGDPVTESTLARPTPTSSTTTTTTPTIRPAPASTTPGLPTSINPCTLFTAADASRLTGKPLTRVTGTDLGSGTCAYSAGTVVIGAELTVKVDASADAAHAEFAVWVQPVPVTAPGFSVTRIANLGDEAKVTHSGFSDGVYFRDAAVLVKIGVYPPVSDAALIAAANAARARL